LNRREDERGGKWNGAAVILGLGWLLLTGCVDRAVYEWNLKHAYVTPWTHLSPSDHEEIVRLISSANNEPIAGMTSHPPWDDGSTVTVYTDGNTDRNESKYWTGYSLKKENGKWRVTFHGDASPIIAQMALSEQQPKPKKRR
jgi:hypothetical protein